MIAARSFANHDVGVFGLARSGISAAEALVAGGARVFAWDDGGVSRGELSSDVKVQPWREWPWASLKSLILSPGIPLTHPKPHEIVEHAKAYNVPVIGDLELFAREIRSDRSSPGRAPLVAITGTNGKSTTTALIGHILSSCGFNAEIGGNIGKPALDLSQDGSKTIYVLETSSYQIDLAPGLTPDVAVLTNITPDHIDRHGSLEGYAAVKAKLLAQTAKDGRICIGVDDAQSAAIYTRFASNGSPEALPVSVGKVLGRGIFVLDGVLYDASGGRAAKVMELSAAAHLPGAHNWQNIALAFAAARRFVGDTDAIVSAIVRFPGLPHRIEDVGRVGKVRFINDSKATNAEAAERALVCFPDIYWIAGGRPKEGGIESLRPNFARIRKAYLIGEAANDFARSLGDVPHTISGTLNRAVEQAFADASKGNEAAPVVLLSPACASFDQFKDYEARGNAFRDAATRLSALPVREAS
ncbi:MAG TPA: UDP-N-acetylmuramoyl-L-alanine--D-glutamate ligase [Rhizomicrobium sp.]|nr:UDP-N-acetylmuramoyl-L-alanine--D-glutamate ligase [Rhizomicrobium sp.]